MLFLACAGPGGPNKPVFKETKRFKKNRKTKLLGEKLQMHIPNPLTKAWFIAFRIPLLRSSEILYIQQVQQYALVPEILKLFYSICLTVIFCYF